MQQADQGTLLRAADMLCAYAEMIRRDGVSRVEEHHFLPEVEWVASELRAAATRPCSNAMEVALLRIAAYPRTRAEELSIDSAREISRAALAFCKPASAPTQGQR